MKCPVCKDVNLQINTREWVEIDYCPECRWVWLDRWELDKLIERSNSFSSVERKSRDGDKNSNYEKEYERNNFENDRDRNNYWDRKPHKKKESMWWELFDF